MDYMVFFKYLEPVKLFLKIYSYSEQREIHFIIFYSKKLPRFFTQDIKYKTEIEKSGTFFSKFSLKRKFWLKNIFVFYTCLNFDIYALREIDKLGSKYKQGLIINVYLFTRKIFLTIYIYSLLNEQIFL